MAEWERRRRQAHQAVDLLEQEYPDAVCSLDYDPSKAHELLISVRLAAQSTDARVNLVTEKTFQQYRTGEDYANAKEEDIEECVRSCGLYKTKARDIVNMSKMIVEQFGGKVPDNMDDLLKLPGVGRKSANLILGDVYGQPAVVCDTHCIRITNLLGLTTTKDPLKTERELRQLLPMDRANDFCHRLVIHGRAVCVARRPNCAQCVLAPCCDYAQREGKAL